MLYRLELISNTIAPPFWITSATMQTGDGNLEWATLDECKPGQDVDLRFLMLFLSNQYIVLSTLLQVSPQLQVGKRTIFVGQRYPTHGFSWFNCYRGKEKIKLDDLSKWSAFFSSLIPACCLNIFVIAARVNS